MFPGSRLPMYPGGQQSENHRADLFRCLVNCLKTADDLKVKSLAIPAISCGIYGGAIEDFANLLYKAIQTGDWEIEKLIVVLFTPLEYDKFMAVWPATVWPE